MNKETALQLLKDLGIDTSSVYMDGDEVQCHCPLAPWTHSKGVDLHPSMSINIEKNPPVFYCFACKAKGLLTTLIKQYNEYSGRNVLANKYVSRYAHLRPKEKVKKVFTEMPLPKTLLDNFFDYTEFDRAVKYVHEVRSIRPSVAKDYQLMYDPERDMVVFPIYNAKKQFMGAVGRSIEGEKRYHNYFNAKLAATLGGIDKVKNPKRLFVVEGYFDLLTCAPWVPKYEGGVVCTWKSEMSAGQAALLSSVDSVIYCLYDSDIAGDKGWDTIRSYYGSICGSLCRRMRLPEGLDVNNVIEEEFHDCFQESLKGRIL